MSAATTPPLHVLRGILRCIKTSPSSALSASASSTISPAASTIATNNNQLTIHQHIITQYRESKSLPPKEATRQRQIAYHYYILKQDLAERARLHELDQGADEKLSPKELSRRAAARAGLQLPKMDSGFSAE